MSAVQPSHSLNLFFMHCATERGLAVRTMKRYRRVLGSVEAWLIKRGSTFISASAETLGEYLATMTRGGAESITVRQTRDVIRNALTYLTDIGAAAARIVCAQLDAPKIEHKIPFVPNREEVVRWITAVPPASKFYLRNRAILETLYACGLRSSELIGLRLRDVDFEAYSVRVLGKGSKERVVPLGNVAAETIKTYLADLRPKLNKLSNDVLFLTESGRALEAVSLHRMVELAGVQAGLRDHVHPHILRHCFATHLVSAGADLRVVQELLGHESIMATERYLHCDASRLKAVCNEFHPRP